MGVAGDHQKFGDGKVRLEGHSPISAGGIGGKACPGPRENRCEALWRIRACLGSVRSGQAERKDELKERIFLLEIPYYNRGLKEWVMDFPSAGIQPDIPSVNKKTNGYIMYASAKSGGRLTINRWP